jgi:hypothetical protein
MKEEDDDDDEEHLPVRTLALSRFNTGSDGGKISSSDAYCR